MQASDNEIIDTAARDALMMLDKLAKTKGDIETYRTFLKIDDSHKAVKLIINLVRSWLKASLAREIWRQGPRARVSITKTAGEDKPFASFSPQDHKIYLHDRFFGETGR